MSAASRARSDDGGGKTAEPPAASETARRLRPPAAAQRPTIGIVDEQTGYAATFDVDKACGDLSYILVQKRYWSAEVYLFSAATAALRVAGAACSGRSARRSR